MSSEEIACRLRHELRQCLRKKKYMGQFDAEDEARVIRVFELALLNPSLSEEVLFELLTSEGL